MALSIGTSQAIAPFAAIIAKIPVLAVIMPLFSNVGGSVGTQTLTVTIRSIGIGEVTPKDTLKILGKEVLAGLGTALGLGLAMTLIALIWTLPNERWVALVAGTVMATNTVIGVTMGTLVPMGFERLNLDPALISAPLVTTLLDMVGFFVFLSLITIGSNILHL
jgi:magnesium transporter